MEVEGPDYVGLNVEELYSSSSAIFLPDATGVERAAECQSDEIMTGFCGRVDGNSNFTHVSVYCRKVDASSGALGSQHQHGDTDCAELTVIADDGFVAVGAAASVANNNLNLAAVRQCQWLPESNRVWVTTSSEVCEWKNHAGVRTTTAPIAEKVVDSHAGQTILERRRRVLRGVGLTASSDEAVGRLRIGYGALDP